MSRGSEFEVWCATMRRLLIYCFPASDRSMTLFLDLEILAKHALVEREHPYKPTTASPSMLHVCEGRGKIATANHSIHSLHIP